VMPLYIRAAVSVSSLISVQRFSPPVAFFPRRTNRGGNQGGGEGGERGLGRAGEDTFLACVSLFLSPA